MGETEIIIEPGQQDIVIKREFAAPRDLVFKVYTDPGLIPNWYGPRQYETIVDKMDVRPGGQWRFINRDDQGNEFGFKGVYHDVVAPERIVQTFEFEGAPGHVSLETLTLEEVDGRRWPPPSLSSRASPTAMGWSSRGWRVVCATRTTVWTNF